MRWTIGIYLLSDGLKHENILSAAQVEERMGKGHIKLPGIISYFPDVTSRVKYKATRYNGLVDAAVNKFCRNRNFEWKYLFCNYRMGLVVETAAVICNLKCLAKHVLECF